MSELTSALAFRTRATGSDLKLTVSLNGQMFFDQLISSDETVINYSFPDTDDTEYVLEIAMSGKLPEHTKVDADGNITQDRVIEVSDLSLDDIDSTQLFIENAEYHHNFNGSKDPVVDKFFGSMGCNGVIKFKFKTPIYIWLLENM